MAKFQKNFFKTKKGELWLMSLVTVFSILALLMSIVAIVGNAGDKLPFSFEPYVLISSIYLVTGLRKIALALSAKNGFDVRKNIFFAFILIGISIASYFTASQTIPHCAYAITYSFVLSLNSISAMKKTNAKDVKTSIILISIITVLVTGGLVFETINNPSAVQNELLILTLVVSIVETMAFILARIKLKIIYKIIKKTYAFEVLYGLLILVFLFSFVFFVYEAKFETYGDAIWYCFAIVTTIGFGDYYATTTLCRILSFILGVYGLIVVAVITSIIVNFYSEMNAKEIENANDEIMEEAKKDEKKDEGKAKKKK